MLAGILLAAGESSRMGFPKPLLPYRGTTFLGHLLDVLRGQVEPVVLVLGHEAARIRRSVAIPPDVRVVVNRAYRSGQLSSLQAALRSLKTRDAAEGALVALVDHPGIDRELVSQLARAFDEERPPVLIPTYHGRRGHPMIFSAELFPELLGAPLQEGARWVVHRHPPRELPVTQEGVVLDIDDPDTYWRVTGNKVPGSGAG